MNMNKDVWYKLKYIGESFGVDELTNGNRQKSRPITITEKKKYKHLFKGV